MDILFYCIAFVAGALVGATAGYRWISAELVTAKADLSNLIAKAKLLVDPATATVPVTPTASLAAAVAAVKTKV